MITENKCNWILGVPMEEGQIESQSKAWNYAIVFVTDEECCTQGWCYWQVLQSHVYQLSNVMSKWKETNDYVHLLTHGLMKRTRKNDWQGKNYEVQNEERHITMQKTKAKMLKNVSCTFLL